MKTIDKLKAFQNGMSVDSINDLDRRQKKFKREEYDTGFGGEMI